MRISLGTLLFLCLGIHVAHAFRLKNMIESAKSNGTEGVMVHSSTEAEEQKMLKYKAEEMNFNLAACLLNFTNLVTMAGEGSKVCQHVFSCNNFWAGEVMMEIMGLSFCFINNWEINVDSVERMPVDDSIRSMLTNVVAPTIEMMMKSVKMKPNKTSTDPSTSTHSFAQVDDCKAKENIRVKMNCLMNQAREVFENKLPVPKKPSMSTEDAADMRSKLITLKEGLQLMEKTNTQRKLRALEMGGSSDSNSTSETELYMDPANGLWTDTQLLLGPEDDIPLGPFDNALTAAEPNLTYRFDHAQPGLMMHGHYLTDIDPKARCNDGSPGIYYLKNGTNKNAFHLHLEGGYFCYNKRNCIKRVKESPMLGSSKGYEMWYTGSGIFDPHNGGLEGYTHVTMSYCSSDAYFGQVDIPDFEVVTGTIIDEKKNTTGTFFRGYTMIQAVLKMFVEMGLGSEPHQRLVVSGCSAGAIGVTAQTDSFLERVHTIFRANDMLGDFYPPYVMTVSDNMPVMSPDPIAINFNGELPLLKQALALVDILYTKPGISPGEFLNADCAAAYPDNPAVCVFPEQVLPHIKTPNLVLNNQMDTFTLYNPAAFFQPMNPQDQAFASMVVKETRKVMNKVAPNQNMWSIGCNDHCFSTNPFWWRLTTVTSPKYPNLSPKEMMVMTISGTTGQVAMDMCDEYNCACGGQAQTYSSMMLMQFMYQSAYNNGFTKMAHTAR